MALDKTNAVIYLPGCTDILFDTYPVKKERIKYKEPVKNL